jgi:hypothetical protein
MLSEVANYRGWLTRGGVDLYVCFVNCLASLISSKRVGVDIYSE